jgi:hypothetical protein
MAGSRLVRTALCCYPQRWRNRHGEEAAELARLLLRDGTPARSIAWSYFKGAASMRLVPPRRRAGAAVGALLAAGSLGVSLAMLSSSAPANAVTGPCSGVARAAGPASRGLTPDSHYHVAGGTARSSAAASIRVTTEKPADSSAKGRHDQRC